MRRTVAGALTVLSLASALGACSIIKAPPVSATATGTLQGVITGPGGPVPNAAIDITASDATLHSGASNAAGYYSIAGIPAGPASFAVRASGYANVTGTVTIVADPGLNRQDVSLNPL